MSGKRSRATYEADLQAQQSPYVVFGTALPPRDPDVRDDGSYVPVWKQEVRDERGLKRLHGAFTGGFSAGYFNTVGSKEGWTPSTFVSSRSNRQKDKHQDGQNVTHQRPEDFMDDEDIADAAEAQRIQTTERFSGLGSTEDDVGRRDAFVDLFRVEGETMGAKLLKKMGWREGQGVGPKVRRRARLDGTETSGGDNADALHLFAPENTNMISFVKKNDHKGLGFEGVPKLSSEARPNGRPRRSEDEDEDDDHNPMASRSHKSKKPIRGGIGIGILNDTGSDDEDPYEIGPQISYNRIIGGDKKKKKSAVSGAANALLKSKPVFISKKTAMAKASAGLRKCHDGRSPLDGFVLSNVDTLSSMSQSQVGYAPPKIPEGWSSSKEPRASSQHSHYTSTTDAAKASKLDPKSRASILGEAALPGKSVFDFLSPSARDRLVSASGKSNLPAARGEIPQGYILTDEERRKELLSQIPKLEKDVAVAALTRGVSGFMPYGEDLPKRGRYRAFLEYGAGITQELPKRRVGISKDQWSKELKEFVDCAQIFKPMTTMMASRFTVSTTTHKSVSDAPDSLNESLLSKPIKPEDPAEAAAKVGMYGPLTRSSQDFYPTRLLCKRFNIKPPAHVKADVGEDASVGTKAEDLVSRSTIEDIRMESGMGQQWSGDRGNDPEQMTGIEKVPEVVVDTERNEALEGQRAGEAVFKAIFGDDSDDD